MAGCREKSLTICVEGGELALRAVLRTVHQQVLTQAIRLHQRVRETHTVRPHGIATSIVYVADFLIIIVGHCFRSLPHRPCLSLADKWILAQLRNKSEDDDCLRTVRLPVSSSLAAAGSASTSPMLQLRVRTNVFWLVQRKQRSRSPVNLDRPGLGPETKVVLRLVSRPGEECHRTALHLIRPPKLQRSLPECKQCSESPAAILDLATLFSTAYVACWVWGLSRRNGS